ncbi:hypothetical protein SAMN02745857_01451 [Andreprevotia lacus DSM 23236]|jgi:competence protein ComGC|uniref:PilX N-terminal n=1 Tax=Andreprevotia lacus DSM 23236 TaxID=1121001 RepID=A0A1W1XG03_9NEIS|nr:hypothetical protein [Andreprevotia lacus]SMC22722.1 hypothetical protein SAMN02745857_01451 [Andreprevotia lacus DSM 23236]
MLRARQQSGAATLLGAMVSLLIMTIVMFFISNVTISDSVASVAYVRAARSFNAAEAGVDAIIAQLNADKTNNPASMTYLCSSGYVKSSSGTACQNSSADAGNAYVVAATSLSDAALQYTATLTRTNTNGPITIASTGGFSGCLSSGCTRQQVTTQIALAKFFPASPSDAISTTGPINLNGSGCVQNTSGTGYAIRAGSSVGSTNNLNGSSCTANNGNGTFGASDAFDANLGYMSSVAPATMPDNSGNSYPYFQQMFGRTPNDVWAVKDGTSLPNDSDGTVTAGKIYWLTGAIDLQGGVYGTASSPVIIIVNGSLTMRGNTTINGLLFVWGASDISGNVTVNGSIMDDGAFNKSTGNMTVIYDPNIVSNASNIKGQFTKTAGSWKDF